MSKSAFTAIYNELVTQTGTLLAVMFLAALSLSAAPTLDLAVSIDLSHLLNSQVTADRQGNIVVAGYATACSFPVVNPISSCGPIWIAKLDPAGQAILFATYIGVPRSTGTNAAVSLAGLKTDGDGNIVVVSTVSQTSLPAVNAIQSSVKGQANLYLLKLAADGSQLIYATYLGGSGSDVASRLALDSSGAAYVVVYTNSPDFPSTPQSVTTSDYGKTVVAKLSSDGQSLGYGVSFPYDYTLYPPQIDSSGSAFITFFNYVLKLAPDGSSLQRTSFPAWTQGSYPQFLPTGDGGFWLTGTTNNGFIPVTPDAFEPFVGPVPYQRIENGQISSPATLTPAHQVFNFAVDSFERFRIYAATDGGLFRSEDNGLTWNRLTSASSSSIAVDPFDQNTLYLGASMADSQGAALYKSIDRGQTWSPAIQGIATSYSSYAVTSIAADPNVPGLIYAVGNLTQCSPCWGTIYRSNDGGLSWAPYQFPTIPHGTPSSNEVTWPLFVRADPTHPSRVYTVTESTCLGFCPRLSSLYRSDDGGQTFSLVYASGSSDLAVDPSTGDVFTLIAGKLTVFRNADFSNPEVLAVTTGLALAFDPNQPGTLYVSLADGTILQSSDGGETWNPMGTASSPVGRIAVSTGGVINLGQQITSVDAFAFKYDLSGNVAYGTYFGGLSTLQKDAVLAPNGHLFLAGLTAAGLPVLNAFQAQFAGATDGWIAEFDASGVLLSSTYLGGMGKDEIDSLIPLDDGSMVLIGSTESADFPGLQPSVLGAGSTFVARLTFH